jgi:tetratricopeptide (TPR) repeat protein
MQAFQYARVFLVLLFSSKNAVRQRPMTTLYDVLGVHSDADDETLGWAFRQALAANPRGRGAGDDPLFQRIASSGILKDVKQRTIYERLLERERGRLLSKSKRIAVSNTVAAGFAVLASTVAAGFALLAPGAETAVIAAALDDGASRPAAAGTGNVVATSNGGTVTMAAVRKNAADMRLATPPMNDNAAFTAVEAAGKDAAQAATEPANNTKMQAGTSAAERDAGPAAEVAPAAARTDTAAVPAAPRKEPEAPAAVKRDVGAAVAAVNRNDEAVAVDSGKDGVPMISPSWIPQTAAVQPSTWTEPKVPDALRERPKNNDVPDAAAEQGAALPATNGGRVFGFQPGDVKFRNDAQFYRERGIISYKRGALQQAISDLDEAIKLDRGDVQSLVLHGNISDELGAFERALADYDDAIRLEPGNGAIFHDRAILWHRRGDLDKALADLDRAIRGNFADVKMYCDRGLILYERGSYDRAAADFNQAVRIDPTYTATCIKRGVLLHRNSEYSLALAAAYPAIRVDPKVFDLYRRSAARRPAARPETHPSQTAPAAIAVPPEPAESPGVPQGPLSNR